MRWRANSSGDCCDRYRRAPIESPSNRLRVRGAASSRLWYVKRVQTGVTTVLRELRDGDVSFVDSLITVAFGRPGRPQPLPSASPAGEICYVAERSGAIVGFAAARSYGSVAYIGPMAVDASARRQGIARNLMRKLIASLRSSSCSTLLLDATEPGVPLYEGFGFSQVDCTDVYERDVDGRPSARSAEVAEHQLPAAFAIDRRIAGCDRSATLSRFAQEPNAWLEVRERGYVLIHGRVAGPWLADCDSVARQLFDAALKARPQVNVVFSPRSNRESASILSDAGFHLVRSLRHLSYGPPSPMLRTSVFGQGSLGHG